MCVVVAMHVACHPAVARATILWEATERESVVGDSRLVHLISFVASPERELGRFVRQLVFVGFDKGIILAPARAD